MLGDPIQALMLWAFGGGICVGWIIAGVFRVMRGSS